MLLPERGKFNVPSFLNVDLRASDDFLKAYVHNGFFKSLEDIIFFYSWRGLTMNGGLGMSGRGGFGLVRNGLNPVDFPRLTYAFIPQSDTVISVFYTEMTSKNKIFLRIISQIEILFSY